MLLGCRKGRKTSCGTARRDRQRRQVEGGLQRPHLRAGVRKMSKERLIRPREGRGRRRHFWD
eukprot:7416973-Pyramimonas_sp.AAC.1